MQLTESKDYGVQLVTAMMHHYNLFLIYICQSLFMKSKHNAMMSRQASYVILFRNKRNMYEAEALARQIQLESRDIKYIFKDLSQYTHRPYLLVDCRPETTNYRGLTSHILSDEAPKFFYQPPDC